MQIIGYVLMTKEGKFALLDSDSCGHLWASDTLSFSPMVRTVFTLEEARGLVDSWNKTPIYGFAGMTIRPLFLNESEELSAELATKEDPVWHDVVIELAKALREGDQQGVHAVHKRVKSLVRPR